MATRRRAYTIKRNPLPRRLIAVKIRGTIQIPEEAFNRAREEVRSWYGVILRKAQLLRYVCRNMPLAMDLYENCVDTVVRETIVNEIAMDVTGRGWPVFGDGERTWALFAKEFNEKAGSKGYRLEYLLETRPFLKRLRKCENRVPGRKRVLPGIKSAAWNKWYLGVRNTLERSAHGPQDGGWQIAV